jgi:hypothetical protein
MTSGGSSGSPVINIEGEAIALNAGSIVILLSNYLSSYLQYQIKAVQPLQQLRFSYL